MDDVFNNAFEGEGKQQPEQAQAELVAATLPQEAQTGEATGQPEAGATPAQGTEKHVPLAALEAERAGRKDWKEKALRFEGEMKALREQIERFQQPQNQPQGQQSPEQNMSLEERTAFRMFNERLNVSEMITRSKYPDVDDHVNVFKQAAASDPTLQAKMQQAPNPWEYAYQEGKRLKLMTEMGNDPDAYRKKLRDEIMAELQQQPAQASQTEQPRTALPQSLATARSAATRGSSTFTGPTPFDNMFPN